MTDDLRSCSRTACRWPAAASLSFRYATREVWLLDLTEHPDPSMYDLCPHHADALTVPVGWERVDQRSGASGSTERVIDVRESQARAAERAANRYAELSRQLPKLAAAWASAVRDADGDEFVAAHSGGRVGGSAGDGPANGPVPARDLSAAFQDLPPGQLAIPVEEHEGGDAVVVSIELAGRRRSAE